MLPEDHVLHRASDEELIGLLAEESQEALSLLYQRWSSILMGIGMRFVSDRSQVEDILHDVFLEIWKTCRDFDPERGAARTWIVMKMRCRMLDHVRKAKRHHTLQPQVKEHMTPTVSEPRPDTAYANTQLRQRITALPERLRTVLILTYFEHLPAHEVGERLDIPTGTVKSRLASARRALKQELEQMDPTLHPLSPPPQPTTGEHTS